MKPLSISLLLALFFLCGCSASKSSLPEKGTLNGIVYSMGNDPFTKLGFRTSDGKVYILQCSKELDAVLSAKQGIKVTLQYNGVQSTPEGTILTIAAID